MTDFFIRPIPLPVPRPSGLYSEYEPTIAATMPLESLRKAADAFNGGESYHPTSPIVKPLYGLLIESSSFWWFWGILIVGGYIVYRFKRWQRLGL